MTGIAFQNDGRTADGSTCTVVSGRTFVEFRYCTWSYGDIGVRALNNDFALSFTDCQAGAGLTLNVALHLDGGVNDSGQIVPGQGSGNQIVLRNAWFSGEMFGVCIASSNDGINLRDGQFGCGGGDGSGCIGIAIDYITGFTSEYGGVGEIVLDGNDFEGMSGWVVRGFGQVSLLMQSCPVICYSPPNPQAQGVIKIENAQNSRITLINNDVTGPFVSDKAIVLLGAYGGHHIEEIGGIYSATFAGADLNLQPQLLLWQSGLDGSGSASTYAGIGGSVKYLDKVLLRTRNGILQSSTDNVAWLAVGQSGLILPNGLPPSSQPPALVGWYQADHIIGVGDTQPIMVWPDTSGLGNDAFQDYSDDAPRLASSRNNVLLPPAGQPVVAFDGSQSYFSTPLPADTTLAGLVVFDVTAMPPNSVEGIIGSSNVGGLAVRFALTDTPPSIELEADSVSQLKAFFVTPPALNRYYVFGWSYANPGAYVFTLNTTVVAQGAATFTLIPGSTLLIGRVHGGGVFPGQFAEMALYDGPLTADQLLAVAQGLMYKYSILG